MGILDNRMDDGAPNDQYTWGGDCNCGYPQGFPSQAWRIIESEPPR